MTGVDGDEYAPYDPLQLPGAMPLAEPEPADDAPAFTAAPAAFDERCWEPFTGLIYIGAMTKTFSLFGHTIHIRTLKSDELLAVAMLTAKYAGTLGEAKAYNRAVVCQAVVSVDGAALPMPLGEGPDVGSWAAQRFDWVGASWFHTVIDPIYVAYLELTEQVEQVVDAMGKASLQPG